MRAFARLAGLLALLCAGGAVASGFEFCDLAGSIQNVTAQPNNEYALSVHIAKASRAKAHGDISYTDCHEHMGELLDVAFTAAELPRVPEAGDEIAFSRSVVDGFGKDGAYAGTSINTQLHALRKPAAAAGR